MNMAGDSAEQVFKMTLEGVTVVAKIAGVGAKNLIAMLYTMLKDKDKNKVKGRASLGAMLKSGKELKIFSVKESDLKQFSSEAKRYGVVYSALREKGGSEDGLVDVMVRAEDASKINRIAERFKIATVDKATISHEIESTKEKVEIDVDLDRTDIKIDENLIDDLFGKEEKPLNPNMAMTNQNPPSEPTSKNSNNFGKEGSTATNKKSVKDELAAIQNELKQDKSKQKETQPKQTKQQNLKHTQPKPKRKYKQKVK